MRKIVCFLIIIFLIILTGCNDLSGGKSDFEDKAVELQTVVKGATLFPGDEIEVEYELADSETTLDRLEINVTGPEGRIVSSIVIEEQPLTGWVSPIDIEQTSVEGLYTAEFAFYSGEELFYSETREFFVVSSISQIKSVNSYPPVLYPGGSGLFHADIESFDSNCWLRWTLGGENIAEGSASEGYGSIEIEAPHSEGVYDLTLEVFPFSPSDDSGFGFESNVKKNIPLYVNTEQKSGVTEFGPADDFYTLFHFRGSYYNSSDPENSGIESLQPVGQPQLAVRNGVFGYYLDTNSGFSAEGLMVPISDGRLKSFSFMTSVIPYGFNADESEFDSTNIFYSGYADGSFYTSCDALPDGRLEASVVINDQSYTLLSENPLLHENTYSAVSFSIHPSEDGLRLAWYLDGVPESEINYPVPADSVAPWMNISDDDKTVESRLFGAGRFEGLVDEIGVYYNENTSDPAVDPGQFRRAMELEFGKSLMYAEGFDGKAEELILNSIDVSIKDSALLIPPGTSVDFPPIYPGYEEVVFRMGIGDSEFGKSEAVFYVDDDKSEIVKIDFSQEDGNGELITFSLIFTPDSVGLDGTTAQDGETGFSGDFSGVGYSIKNNDSEKILNIESILIIRKNINISETKSDETERLLDLGALSAGKNIRS